MYRHRRFMLWLSLGLLLVVLFAGWPGRHEVAGQGEVLSIVNNLRAEYGLPGYTYNAQLAAAAQRHANWMAATGIYSHYADDGSSPYSRAVDAGYSGSVSENIVGGSGLSAQQAVTWWINSPSHFNSLISNQYVEGGVGFAQGNGQNFYVLVVGYQTPAAPAAPAAGAGNDGASGGNPDQFRVGSLPLASPREDGSIVHTVGSGQSLWSIAARYGVPLQDILLYNNLTESSTINPGNELIIRLADGADPPPTPTPPTTHVVIAGDSAWTIAARYRISLDDFLWFNGRSENDVLNPGDVVTIRLAEGQEPPPTPTPRLAHIVQSGDTLWSISLQYGLTVDQLLQYNGFNPNTVLSIGQEVLIRPPVTPTAPPPTFTPVASYTPPSPNMMGVAMAAGEEEATPTPTPTSQIAAVVGRVQDGDTASAARPVTETGGFDWALTLLILFLIAVVIAVGVGIYLAVQRMVPDVD